MIPQRNIKIATISILTLLTLIITTFSSCGTIDTELPEDADAKTILIKAQKEQSTARTDKDYELVLKIYLELLRRFPDDINTGATAKYEIGLIYFKLKEYEEAQKWFKDVMVSYNENNNKVADYPVWTFKLAEIMLKKIDDELNPDKDKKKENEEKELDKPSEIN
jgi:tetratricopeptide (TPR) repeat protein